MRLLCLPLSLFLLVSTVATADFHVSTAGDDRWSGTLGAPSLSKEDGPFATLTRAVEAARKLNLHTKADRPSVVVHGGEYFLASPLDLTSADSGLTIEAAPGETPVLYGGRLVTGWQREESHLWSAKLPGVVRGDWDFRLLVADGTMCSRSRLPEQGEFTHLSEFKVPWMSTTGGGWKRPPTEAELTHLRYRPADLGPWLDTKNAELRIYHMWDESSVGLSAHDPITHTLTFSNPAGHPPGAFGVQKYVVFNTREGLCSPGQWYLDRTAGKLVYWPLEQEDIRRVQIIAPLMETIIRIQGSRDAPAKRITIKGLTLSVTNTPLKSGGFGAGAFEGAITLSDAQDCHLRDLTIFNVAGQGIKTERTDRLRIEGCEVHDIGACGIQTDGRDSVIFNNHIFCVGVLYPSAIGLYAGGQHIEMSHNEIHDTTYSAINGGGDGNRIEHNLIYRAMLELHDGAGIYVGFCKGVVLRGNMIHNIDDTGGYGASAYYLDEQAENCLVEENLAVDVGNPSHNHMARNNIIRNNVFVNSGDMKLTFPRCLGFIFEKNVLYAGGEIHFQSPPEGLVSMSCNLIYSGKAHVTMEQLSDYERNGKNDWSFRDGSLMKDPLFMNASQRDFRFQVDSPAWKLGIRQLDWSKAGRQGRK